MAKQQGLNAQLEGGRELPYLNLREPFLGSILQRIIAAVNQTAKNAAVSSVGKITPPPPVASINVQGSLSGGTLTAPSEILHWTLNHPGAIQKNIRYISEVDTDPNFPAPHVVDHGCSRSAFLTLPTKTTEGATQTYYLRSYAQYHGSDPCKPTVHGNLGGATKIQMTGSSQTTLLTSAGSGTASPNGQQGGHGLGIVLDRPAPGPTRNVS
jgi:hypothetical protein